MKTIDVVLFPDDVEIVAAMRALLFEQGPERREIPDGFGSGTFGGLSLDGERLHDNGWVARAGSSPTPASSGPLSRRQLFDDCAAYADGVPWALRGWWGRASAHLGALVTSNRDLAVEFASRARAAGPDAFIRHYEGCSNFDHVFRTICFVAMGHEGEDAWRLAQRESATPLVVIDEVDTPNDIQPSLLDPGDPDHRFVLDALGTLEESHALPVLARAEEWSVRRCEDPELYRRMFALCSWDHHPTWMACSPQSDPQAVLRGLARYDEGLDSCRGGEFVSDETQAWFNWLEYGGGSDEYTGWLTSRSPELTAEAAGWIEERNGLLALF